MLIALSDHWSCTLPEARSQNTMCTRTAHPPVRSILLCPSRPPRSSAPRSPHPTWHGTPTPSHLIASASRYHHRIDPTLSFNTDTQSPISSDHLPIYQTETEVEMNFFGQKEEKPAGPDPLFAGESNNMVLEDWWCS